MLRLRATIIKELLVLSRDKSGLAILFIMPVALVTIMALIQDAPFRDYQEMKIPALIINKDQGELGKKIVEGLNDSKMFEITFSDSSSEYVKQIMQTGEFEMAVVIPENAGSGLESKVNDFVEETLASLGVAEEKIRDSSEVKNNIEVYFKPGIKPSFKNMVMSSVKEVSSKLESESLLDAFRNSLQTENSDASAEKEDFGEFISFEVIQTNTGEETHQLNSVQHNVPAWTLFGMFFIVISLAGSIIREREDGSYTRILTMPGSYLTVLGGKIITYLGVCLIQCLLMLGVGIALLPLFGLPELVIGDNLAAIAASALCSGLAATGYGVLVGTIFNTHQQSSTFGSVSVVILAELGGIWVPVYVMPEAVRVIAEFSPLYWGLNAFQLTFLGNGSLAPVSGYLYKLLLFFASTLALSLIINRIKNN
jgi:ABC-2 type transport system permease protein